MADLLLDFFKGAPREVLNIPDGHRKHRQVIVNAPICAVFITVKLVQSQLVFLVA